MVKSGYSASPSFSRAAFGALAAASLMLTACGDSSDEAEETAKNENAGPPSAEKVAAESKKLVKPKPGQYSSKSEVTRFEVPGVPKQQAEQMKQMFTGLGAEEQSFCLTEARASDGFEETLRRMAEGDQGMNCKYERISVKGETLDAKLTCDAAGRGQATMTMSGKLGANNQVVEMLIEQKNGDIPGGMMNIGMKVTNKRTGECTAKSRKEAEEMDRQIAEAMASTEKSGAQDKASPPAAKAKQ